MFFTFSENNSGGFFSNLPDVGDTTIIEADSAAEAVRIAESLGIYFDGVRNGLDCECCGDRWYAPWDDSEGTEVPSIYGDTITASDFRYRKAEDTFIHYADGTVLSAADYLALSDNID